MSDFTVRDASEHYSGELALAKRLEAAEGLAAALRVYVNSAPMDTPAKRAAYLAGNDALAAWNEAKQP